MQFQDLAPELVHQIYNTLSTISDVINLSLTCHRFQHLLRHAQKLPTLFAAAEREFGPIEDISRLVTYTSNTAIQKSNSPILSYALLRQIIRVGATGKAVEQLYPGKRWQNDFWNRRSLSADEAYRVRRATYRYWLYCEAFHNRAYTRSQRLLPSIIEERSQILRTWSSSELCEIEDVRMILEDMFLEEICPTDGVVHQRINDSCHFVDVQLHHSWNSWPPMNRHSTWSYSNIFNSVRDDYAVISNSKMPISQLRNLHMTGWGDEIMQYHAIQSLMKLNPAQILKLVDEVVYRSQIEKIVPEVAEEWFNNNGQTFLDTWAIVLHRRGLVPDEIRHAISEGHLGIAVIGDEKSIITALE